MIQARHAVSATLVLASLIAAAPASAAQGTGTLAQGGEYVIAPSQAVGTAAVGLWFRAPSDGYGPQSAPGIARVAATAASSFKLASGRSLSETVRDLGGQLFIDVFPDMVGVHAVVPASAARRIVAAMSAAYFAPAIDDAAVKTAQRDAAVLSVEQRYSPDESLHDLLFAQLFSGRPAAVSPVPAGVPAVTAIASSGAADFAKRAFRSGNAVLTLTGNVDASLLSAVTDGTAGPGDPPIDSAPAAMPMAISNVNGHVAGVGMAWMGPPISDERTATALDFLSDYLFRDETGTVALAMQGDEKTFVTGQFVTLHDPGVMLVTISGTNLAAARKIVDGEIVKAQAPLARERFEAAREAFIYHLAADTQTPFEQGANLGWYAVEGNAPYAPFSSSGAYLKAARSLDPDFVAGVARRYLAAPVVVELHDANATKGSGS